MAVCQFSAKDTSLDENWRAPMEDKVAKDTQQRLREIRQITRSGSGHSPSETIAQAMDYLYKTGEFYHWVGVYGLVGDTLHLGPFCGPPTDHTEIPVGRGVCGTAVKDQKNQVIADVNQLDNYLACNLGTKSEIVVLIWSEDRQEILGQIDVDGSALDAFGRDEELFLEEVAIMLRPSMEAWLRDGRPLAPNTPL